MANSLNGSARIQLPSFENILSELNAVSPIADFVIEGHVDTLPLRRDVTSPCQPLRDEGAFGDHTGYDTLPEPYPVLL